MTNFSKYLLVGLLVSTMAVDCTATGRLFRRKCDRRDCERVSCERVSCERASCERASCKRAACDPCAATSECNQPCAAEGCPAATSSHNSNNANCDTYSPASNGAGGVATLAVEPIITDTACPADSVATQLELAPAVATQGYVMPAPLPAETVPVETAPLEKAPIGSVGQEMVEHDPPVNPDFSPADRSADQAIVPPAPVAAPEAVATPTAAPESSDNSVTAAPAATDSPAVGIVGDRYSDQFEELFGPVPANGAATPTSAIEPSVSDSAAADSAAADFTGSDPAGSDPAADSDPLGLFDAPTSAAEDEDAADAPATDSPSEDEPLPDSIFPEPSTPDTPATDSPATISPAGDSLATNSPAEEEPLPDSIFPESSVNESPTNGPDTIASQVDFSNLAERPTVLSAAGGLRSRVDRTWRDETATFRCLARLVKVTAKNVVLRRDNGDELVVPHARLGQADLHFVHQQVIALRVARTRDAAADKLAVAWAHY